MREEKAINKAHKLLLEGTKIYDYYLFNPTVEGAWKKLLGPLKKNSLDPLLSISKMQADLQIVIKLKLIFIYLLMCFLFCTTKLVIILVKKV